MSHVTHITIRCPVHPLHGQTTATPSGFRGLSLACGCELVAQPDNAGWNIKPIATLTATGQGASGAKSY